MSTYNATGRSTPELLSDWAAVMRELRKRDVIRTNNNPVGDIAEAIVAAFYDGTRGAFAQRGWDVRLPSSDMFPDGERVQVKAMRQTPTTNEALVFPRFGGHLMAVPTGAAGRIFVSAQDPALSGGVSS